MKGALKYLKSGGCLLLMTWLSRRLRVHRRRLHLAHHVIYLTLVIFDEAHHAPADTWSAYLEHYSGARFVFLTAIPFRRDGRVIPGKLVYRYPIMRAVAEGAFDLVAFRAGPVQNDLDDQHVDRVIAEAAVQQLRADRDAGHDHRLFVRAASITAARNLAPLYRELWRQSGSGGQQA